MIPPLRGPTRQKAARQKKSGRSGRDDSFWAMCFRGGFMSDINVRPPKEEERVWGVLFFGAFAARLKSCPP